MGFAISTGRRSVVPHHSVRAYVRTALNHAEPVEARWLVWGRSVFAVAVVACSSRSASRTSRCTRAGTRSRTACSGRRAPKASRRSRSRRVGGGRGGHRARRRAAGGQRLAGADAGRRRRVPAPRPRRHAARLHAAAARHAAGARGLARAGAARQLDVFRARRGRPVHAARRRVGAAAASARSGDAAFLLAVRRVLRRRSRSRSTARSIASTGSFYWGDAIAFALLPPLLLHFTMVFPERPSGERRTRASNGSTRCSCR